ncbi:MAG: TonB family protein [Opitutales bacterium]
MRAVYQPPAWGGKFWPGFLQGVALAGALFLLLPLTQYFAGMEVEVPETRRVEIAPPPPPPPPPVDEPDPPVQAAAAPERIPEPARPDPPPLTLRQLELALDADEGVAAHGDFLMNFDLRPGGSGVIDLFDLSDVDQPPRPISARQPRFPRELQRAGISGSVALVFIVDRDGSVKDIQVDHSDHRALESPAIDAVRTWRFLPGEHHGEPARVMVRQTLQFEIR